MNKKILSLSALAILGVSTLFSTTLGAAQMTADTQMTTFGDVMGPVDPDTGRVYGTYEDENLNEFFAGEDIADVPYTDLTKSAKAAPYQVSIPLNGTKSTAATVYEPLVTGYVTNIDPSGAYAKYVIKLTSEETGNVYDSKEIILYQNQKTKVSTNHSFRYDDVRLGAKVTKVQGTKTTIRSQLQIMN